MKFDLGQQIALTLFYAGLPQHMKRCGESFAALGADLSLTNLTTAKTRLLAMASHLEHMEKIIESGLVRTNVKSFLQEVADQLLNNSAPESKPEETK